MFMMPQAMLWAEQQERGPHHNEVASGKTVEADICESAHENVVVIDKSQPGIAKIHHQRTIKGHHGAVNAVAFAPTKRLLATGSADHNIYIWDLLANSISSTLAGHSSDVSSIAWAPDEDHLVSGGHDKTAMIWHVSTADTAHLLKGHSDIIHDVAYHPKGEWVASASKDKAVIIWNPSTGVAKHTLHGHKSCVTCVKFTPGTGTELFSGSLDHSITCWSVADGISLKVYSGPGKDILSIAISPNGKIIASAGKDKAISLWDVESKDHKDLTSNFGHTDAITSLVFDPSGDFLLSGSKDHTALLWNMKTQHIQDPCSHRHTGPVNAVDISPDGKRVVLGSGDKTASLWATVAGAAIHVLKGHTRPVSAVIVSADEKHVITGSVDAKVIVWDVKSGHSMRIFSHHKYAVWTLACSADSQLIASGGMDQEVLVWHAAQDTTAPKSFKGHKGNICAVAFSPNNKYLASASDDAAFVLWNVETGKAIHALKGHTYVVKCMMFHPDSSHVATATNQFVTVWDVEGGFKVQELHHRSGEVTRMQFSSGAARVLGVVANNGGSLWDWKVAQCLEANLFGDFGSLLPQWVDHAEAQLPSAEEGGADKTEITKLKEENAALQKLVREKDQRIVQLEEEINKLKGK